MKTRIFSRRGTAFLTAAALAGAASLSACGGSDEARSQEFTYWSMWDKSEPQAEVLADAIAQFTKDTGIKVKVEWQGRENLAKLAPTLAAVPAADLVDGSQNGLGSTLVSTDKNADLSAVYDLKIGGETETVGEVVPESLLPLIEDGHGDPFMVPYQVTGEAIWYDKAAHPDIAVNPPKTWDEFQSVLDDIKAKGEAPLALDADDAGADAYWGVSPLIRAIGLDAVRELASDKTGEAYDDPKVLETYEKVEKLVEGGYFGEGYNASVNPAQKQKWAAGERAFVLNGTWIPGETKDVAKAGFDYGSFQLPIIDESTGSDAVAVNLFGFGIPNNAKNADAAQKFVAYFLNKESMTELGAKAGVITPREDVAPPAALTEFADALKSRETYPSLAGFGRDFGPWYNEVFFPANQAFMQGQMSADKLVSELQKKTVAFWKAQG